MNTIYTDYDNRIVPVLREHLSEKRLTHVLSVARSALLICDRIGRPDLCEQAYVASLLHDITRERSESEQHDLISAYKIETSSDDLKYPSTLHQLTGAALARDIFPDLVSDDIYDAVSCHCTGKENMSTLSKIVFLSDYIEAGRQYDSSKRVRDAFFSDGALTRAVRLELYEMAAHLSGRMNERTQNTINYYKSQEENKMENMTPKDLALEIVKILDIKNAQDIQLLHVGEKTVIADYFVLCTGESNTQVKSYADEIEYKLSERGIEAHHIEGFAEASWIVLDYSSVVVHAFYKETRDFYGLEKVWADAEKIDISSLITEK